MELRSHEKVGMEDGMRLVRLALLGALLTASCGYDPLVGEFNDEPLAVAQASVDGHLLEEERDGALAVIPFADAPVTVTLDGSGSRDSNGKIVAYRWLSATRIGDAGAPRPWTLDAGAPESFWRWTPPDKALPWPASVVSPTVELGEGTWAFTLWVVDDQGAWSGPDTVRFVIGRADVPLGDAGTATAGASGLDAGR